MKKLLALLLALTLMLSLTACGGDDKDTAAGDSTSTTQTEGSESTGTTDESTGSSGATDSTETSTPATDSTEGTSTPEETSKPTETTKPSETTKPEHKHSYTSKVTKEATCGADGTKTFTCSCGDTYTEKIAATGQHSWGSWSAETKAMVGKDGTEKRTCSTCSATDTQKTNKNAAINSFDDWLLGSFFDFGIHEDKNKNFVETNMVNDYINVILSDGSDETRVSVEQYLATAKKYFSMSEEALGRLVYGSGDTVVIGFQNPSYSIYDLVGYKHDGGNIYTIYYEALNGNNYFEVKLEYNKLNGQPNRYLSIMRVASIPSNLTK